MLPMVKKYNYLRMCSTDFDVDRLKTQLNMLPDTDTQLLLYIPSNLVM